MESSWEDLEEVYGERVEAAFSAAQRLLGNGAAAFAQEFYHHLLEEDRARTILGRLDRTAYEALQRNQERYLQMLISPALELAEHVTHARNVGRIHALSGVENTLLADAYSLYHSRAARLLREHGTPDREADSVLYHLSRRLALDLQIQIECYREIEQSFQNAVLNIGGEMPSQRTLTDAYLRIIERLTPLDGIAGALVTRPDTEGIFQIEAVSSGPVRLFVDDVLRDHRQLFHISARDPSGQGPVGKAWRNRAIAWIDRCSGDSDLSVWKEAASRLGIVSAAAIPVLDVDDQPLIILVLYSPWPGFFSLSFTQTFLNNLQNIIQLSILRFRYRRPVSYQDRQLYHKLLMDEKVEMLYQPIVDLRTGALVKLEALARLRGTDGRLIAPNLFLPVFDSSDLLRLFHVGMRQAAMAISFLTDHGFTGRISLNLPPQGLEDPRFRDIILKTIESGEIEPRQLCLEILESEEIPDSSFRDGFLDYLHDLGVWLALDDLGSGHATLLRMGSLPFDEVKIDQSFVRGDMQRPFQKLGFIQHLARLAHDLGNVVTVEGLEDYGLLEAAAVLGADYGQGYFIARPLALDAVPAWQKQFAIDVDKVNPGTVTGVIASYMEWDLPTPLHGKNTRAISAILDLIGQFRRKCHIPTPARIRKNPGRTSSGRPLGRQVNCLQRSEVKI